MRPAVYLEESLQEVIVETLCTALERVLAVPGVDALIRSQLPDDIAECEPVESEQTHYWLYSKIERKPGLMPDLHEHARKILDVLRVPKTQRVTRKDLIRGHSA